MDQVSTAADWVVVANAILVMVVIWRAINAFRNGLHDWRPFHSVVVALGCIYLASYIWLLTGNIDRRTWSEIMMGVSIVVWAIVWVAPSEFSVRSQASIERLRHRVVDYKDLLIEEEDETSS